MRHHQNKQKKHLTDHFYSHLSQQSLVNATLALIYAFLLMAWPKLDDSLYLTVEKVCLYPLLAGLLFLFAMSIIMYKKNRQRYLLTLISFETKLMIFACMPLIIHVLRMKY